MRQIRQLLFSTLVSLCIASTSWAIPRMINYQGILCDSSGSPVTTTTTVLFAIWDAPGAGDSLWSESHAITPDAQGYFNVLLGSTNPVPDSAVAGDAYISIKVAADPELSPRTQLVAVAYTYRTRSVDGASGGTITSKVSIGPSHTNTGFNAFVAGQNSTSSGDWSTVSGGLSNEASGHGAAVGGGETNTASHSHTTVGGGHHNHASGSHATVAGGLLDTASGDRAVVAGGQFNKARGDFSFVGGGGGLVNADSNSASGASSVVSGGTSNSAHGTYSTVPGGQQNTAAGDYSLAGGRRAHANHDGCLVWGDSFDGDVTSSASNQLTERVSGGARLFSDTALTTGVTLAAGGGAWAAVSDSAVKENVRSVDGADILERLSRLHISRWNYKTQDASIEHIGPMAQDFYRLFRVGDNNTTITAIDPDGIALAAIKELYEKSTRVDIQQATIEAMQTKMD